MSRDRPLFLPWMLAVGALGSGCLELLSEPDHCDAPTMFAVIAGGSVGALALIVAVSNSVHAVRHPAPPPARRRAPGARRPLAWTGRCDPERPDDDGPGPLVRPYAYRALEMNRWGL